MTESQRKAALEALDILYDYAHAYADVSHQHQALGSLIEKRDTIRETLQSPHPEEVTVDEFHSAFKLHRRKENKVQFMIEDIAERYPHGIRIIREKSDGKNITD